MDFIFNQIVGDGANLFMLIVAIVIGFAAGMGYTDYVKTKKEEENQHWFFKSPINKLAFTVREGFFISQLN